jgi:hypothetical protein
MSSLNRQTIDRGPTYHIVIDLDIDGIRVVNGLPATNIPVIFTPSIMSPILRNGRHQLVEISQVFAILGIYSKDNLVKKATVDSQIPL